MVQQVQQQASFDDTDSYNSNDTSTYGEPEQEILAKIIEVRADLDRFEHTVLRGEYEFVDVEKGQKVWKKYDENAKAIINELGIREIMGRLLGYGTPQTVLGYFEEEEIYKNLFYFDMSMAENIAKRSDAWELDVETAKMIKDAAVELIQSILFRAKKGFTAINMRTQYSRSDVSRSDNQPSTKKSFLGISLGK